MTAAELGQLAAAAQMPAVDLFLLKARPLIAQMSDLIAFGTTAQVSDPAFMRDLEHWMRFNLRTTSLRGGGLFSAVSGNPAMPDWLGPFVLNRPYTAVNGTKTIAAKIASTAGMAAFVAAKEDPDHWALFGRACQQFTLQATA